MKRRMGRSTTQSARGLLFITAALLYLHFHGNTKQSSYCGCIMMEIRRCTGVEGLIVDVVVPPQVASTNGSDDNMGCASTIECIYFGWEKLSSLLPLYIVIFRNLVHWWSVCVCSGSSAGRFYEMAYILQLLMENDQFESLLHTGLEKVLHTHHTVHFTLSCIPICMCVWLTVCLKMTIFCT